MKATIIEKIAQYLKNEILQQPDRDIDPEEPLLSSGIIDSFSLIDIALFVEDTFHVHVDDTDLNASTFDSLNELADLIIERQD